MKIKVKVTQGMINRDCHSADNCPIHDALKPFLKRTKGITVMQSQFRCFDLDFSKRRSGHWDYFDNKVSEWIRKYDYGMKVEPFSFTLEIPNEYLKASVLQNK